MRLSGTLRSWNDDRGFGFIAPTHGGAELFVHVSALPRDGSRPTVGEKLTYELGRGKNGKPEATNVQRLAIGPRSERMPARRPESRRNRSLLPRLVGTLLLVAVGAFGFNEYQHRAAVQLRQAEPPTAPTRPDETPAASNFRCDGRTYCSQMTSCAEAKLFLKNCPGTEMDGDRDGTPCEQQWCTGPFAK